MCIFHPNAIHTRQLNNKECHNYQKVETLYIHILIYIIKDICFLIVKNKLSLTFSRNSHMRTHWKDQKKSFFDRASFHCNSNLQSKKQNIKWENVQNHLRHHMQLVSQEMLSMCLTCIQTSYPGECVRIEESRKRFN